LTHTGNIDFPFYGGKEFGLLEILSHVGSPSDDLHVQNYGDIHIVPAPEEQKENVYVSVGFSATTARLLGEVQFSKEDTRLSISIPQYSPSYNSLDGRQPCISTDITVSVKPGSSYREFRITSEDHNMIVQPGIDFSADLLLLNTIAGSISSIPYPDNTTNFGGRDIKIITVSSPISGTWPLYDSLVLESHSGSVKVDLDLKNGSRSYPTEAVFQVKTDSGSIHADVPAIKGAKAPVSSSIIPDRKYRTEINSSSGSVSIAHLHGLRTSIKSMSGSIRAVLTSYGDPNRDSYISVAGSSGTQDISILESLSHPNAPLQRMYDSYDNDAGSMTVRYPAEWEGRISGTYISGSVTLDWPGLVVKRKSNDGLWKAHHIEAEKGRVNGHLQFSSVSGSINLLGRGGKRWYGDADGPGSAGWSEKPNPMGPLITLPDAFENED
jgi:hypothetical protein